MNDLISRQAAIDLAESFYKIDKSVLNIMVFKLKQLPSAQPDVPDTNVGDLISREYAVDVLNRGLSKIPYVNNTDTEMIRRDERMCCIQEIRGLPSVQPVPCEFCKHNNIADDKVCLMCSAERM